MGRIVGLQLNKGPKKLEDMSIEELKKYAENNNIDIGNATSVNGILKKISEIKETEEIAEEE